MGPGCGAEVSVYFLLDSYRMDVCGCGLSLSVSSATSLKWEMAVKHENFFL